MRVSLRLKLLSIIAVGTVMIIALAALSLSRLAASNTNTKALAQRVVPASTVVGQASTLMTKFRKDELHYILSTPAQRAGAAGVSGDLAGDISAMAQILQGYRSRHLISDRQDARDLAAFQTAFDRYVTLSAPFRHLADTNQLVAAGQACCQGAADNEYNVLMAAGTAWTNHQNAVAARIANQSQSTYDSSRTLILILTLLGVVVAVGVALLLARHLTSAVRRVGAAAEAISLGDLDQRVELDTSDEIGEMAREFDAMTDYLRAVAATAERIADGDLAEDVRPRSERDALGRAMGRMAENLRVMIREVTQASTNLSAASQQMASTSEETGRAVGEIAAAVGEVASGAERQVRSVEGARAITEGVAEAAARSADGVRQSTEAAREARSVAARGDEAVSLATEAMRAVRESSGAVTDAIRQLGSKSAEIGGIVQTITAIAEQTNLLALNAAIEAARAGEQGRGFAVVAEEVRKLAEEAQSAAGNIEGLVGEIQSETARTVEVVELGAKRSAEGADTVERAREAFRELGSSVEEMNGRVEAIADAIEEIASSVERMRDDMTSVAEVAEQSSAATQQVSASTEQTSASAQQIAASAADVARSAENLRSLLDRFQLADV